MCVRERERLCVCERESVCVIERESVCVCAVCLFPCQNGSILETSFLPKFADACK